MKSHRTCGARRRGAIDSSCRETETEVGPPLVERKAVAVFVVGVARRRLPHREIEAFDDGSRFPSFRDVAERGVFQVLGEEGGGGGT